MEPRVVLLHSTGKFLRFVLRQRKASVNGKESVQRYWHIPARVNECGVVRQLGVECAGAIHREKGLVLMNSFFLPGATFRGGEM